MLKHRLLTSIIGLPLLLSGIIFLDRSYVCLFFLICACFCVHELANMIYPKLLETQNKGEKENYSYQKKPIFNWPMFCVLSAALLFAISTLDRQGTASGGIIFVLNAIILFSVFSAKSIEKSLTQITCVIVSICYACLPWLSVWDLYLMGSHGRYVLLLLSIVFMGDTGAYFTGRQFGRHKLAPRYSPKKTWEGLFGGLVMSVIGALLMNLVFKESLGPHWLIITAAIMGGVAGVLGDLVESNFKRFAQVKDSGTIFPGHGGFLDRSDSIIFAAPTVWLVFYSYSNLIQR